MTTVVLAAYLGTRRIKLRAAGIGLALQALGIVIYMLGGWEFGALVVALTGSWFVLTSGMIRASC